MLTPIRPGEILLEEFLGPMKLSQNQLARGLGVVMGDKITAKETAKNLGIPVVPGSDGGVPDLDTAGALAAEGVFLNSQPHPRAYGTFARVLGRYVRDEQVISLDLHHRSGFILAQVDACSTFEELIELTGMDRLEALRIMMLTRQMDHRMHRMQRQGKISFYMQSLGEEAISVGQGMVFKPTDMMFPSYRNHDGIDVVAFTSMPGRMLPLGPRGGRQRQNRNVSPSGRLSPSLSSNPV